MKEVKEYLNQILDENDTLVLALSGGPDSMCLLHLLKNSNKNLNIICAHINHNTRESNDKEFEFIKDYLEKENIQLEYYKIKTYKNNRFSEQEAREKRYQFLKKTVKKYQAKYLLTAHHGDDLTETIIMRILRGSTLEGYSGIKKESTWDNVKIIRPLLTMTKKEIMGYIKEEHIPYVVDETNDEDLFLRNRIRHTVLPLLEKEEKNYHLKFMKFSETLNEAYTLLDKEITKKLKEVKEEDKINLKKFLDLEEEYQLLILRKYFKEIYEKDLSLINDKHMNIVMKFLKDRKEETKYINLPQEMLFYKNSQYFWIEKKKEKEEYCIKFEEKTILPNGSIVEKIDKYEEKNNFEIHLNSKEISLPVYITTRKNGMKMAVKNLQGHKKVNDILIDAKVPLEKRDEIPIMIDSNGEILWVLGITKSKYDLAYNENYDIIYKYIKKKGNL